MNFANLIFHGRRNRKEIALTFDDCPSQETSKILNLLRNEKIKATFFVIGKRIKGREKIIRRIISEGHEIGNHSHIHKKLTFKSYKFIEHEIKKCDRILNDEFRVKTNIFRPPYWSFGLTLWIATLALKKIVIFNDVISKDWKLRGVDFALSNALKNVKNGSIINLHDYLEDIGRNKEIVEITSEIIKELKYRGYRFKTVSRIIN